MDPVSSTEFKALAAEADAGRLLLSKDAADQAVAACRARIEWLTVFKDKSTDMIYVGAFGNFGSAQALGKKFESLVGGTPGSFEEVVQSHIDVVNQMREVFEKAGAAYEATDQATRDALNTSGRNL